MSNHKILPIVSLVLILASLAFLAFFVIRGINKPQNAVPSKAAEVDPNKCQGNPNASAKCFKCESGTSKNNPIGIYDFNCFKNFYGQTVGK